MNTLTNQDPDDSGEYDEGYYHCDRIITNLDLISEEDFISLLKDLSP
jgi:hypothetical protein